MSTAPGATCDQCGRTQLCKPITHTGAVPQGWFVVHGPISDVELGVADPRFDLCSLDCLATWAQLRADADLIAAREAEPVFTEEILASLPPEGGYNYAIAPDGTRWRYVPGVGWVRDDV